MSYTYTFNRVSASDVGEWDGAEERAAAYMNRALDELAKQATAKFPDPTEAQRLQIEDLAERFIFADLCSNPEVLDANGRPVEAIDQGEADIRAYVTSMLLNYVDESEGE